MSGYKKELEFAKSLAKETGKIIKANFINGIKIKTEWKSDNTPLTETDTAINSLVIKRVKELFPAHGVIGEEESFNTDKQLKWVCDPVDGTTPFSHGVQISTFSLALTVDGKPVLGVVYDPFIDRLFHASLGGGAYLNDEVLRVSDQKTLKHAMLDVEGFPESNLVINGDPKVLVDISEKGALITNLWSVILPSVLIANGQYTGVIYNVNKCHDAAAVKIIVEEAGGKVTDLFGNEQRYDQKIKGFIASNGHIHQQLLDIIQAHIR